MTFADGERTSSVPGVEPEYTLAPDIDTAREKAHEIHRQLRAALRADAAGYRVTDSLSHCCKLTSDVLACLRTGDE